MKKKVVKRKKQNSFSKEIIGVFIVGVSILLGITLFTKEAGIIGKWIRYGFVGLFGMFAYLTVIIGVVLGIMILQGKKEETRQLIVKLAPMYIIGMPFLHLVAFGQNHTIPLFQFIELASWQNGGLIGALLGYGLLKLIGIYASYVLLILLGGIWILYITQFPLGCWLQNTLQACKEKRKNSSKKKFRVKKIRKKIDKKELVAASQETAVTTEGPIDKSINHDILIYDSSFYEENTDEPLVVSKEEKIPEKKEAKISKQKLDTAEKQAVTKEVETLIHRAAPLTEYHFPPIELLNKGKVIVDKDASKRSLNNAKKLETTLESFGVEARVLQIHKGPTVTRYELQPKQGVKVSKIVNLADDIALNLAASAIRIEAPIPGKSAVGIEVANEKSEVVYLRDVIDTDRFLAFPSQLAFALGKDITGKPIITDIAKMPHILIAGATGSGKSVCINTLITSLIYKATPDEVKLIMIDPKVVELNVYNGIPHLLIPVVTDPKKAAGALWWAVNEMTRRYQLFAATNVRDRKGYNKKVGETEKLPSIVIIIDELADLMMTAAKEVEDAICRLAQMARAAGIHLVIATQRPSVDVITGVIKANIPSRLAFSVSSGIDSRTILDMNGAEKLLGKGDMLFYPIGESKPIRIQGAFISDKEVESIVNAIKVEQIDYEEEILQTIEQPIGQMQTDEEEDELISKAVELAQGKEKLSISMLQRYFRIGFNRASRLMDALESKGVVGPDEGSKPRRVLK